MEEQKVEYFFDTYAIIEILDQNPNYEKYKDKRPTITLFNLAEIYWACLERFNEHELNKIYENYKEAVQEIDDEMLREAVKFRKEHKKQDLSYADCIGYVCALRNDMKFLTGDRQFEKLKNVEFAK